MTYFSFYFKNIFNDFNIYFIIDYIIIFFSFFSYVAIINRDNITYKLKLKFIIC